MTIPNHNKDLYIFIDESGTDDDSNVLYMSLILTEDPESIRNECTKKIQEILHDPELRQNIPSVRERGLNYFHYTSDHPEIKTEVIKLLPLLNFDSYILFARKDELNTTLSKNELLRRKGVSHLFSSLLLNFSILISIMNTPQYVH